MSLLNAHKPPVTSPVTYLDSLENFNAAVTSCENPAYGFARTLAFDFREAARILGQVTTCEWGPLDLYRPNPEVDREELAALAIKISRLSSVFEAVINGKRVIDRGLKKRVSQQLDFIISDMEDWDRQVETTINNKPGSDPSIKAYAIESLRSELRIIPAIGYGDASIHDFHKDGIVGQRKTCSYTKDTTESINEEHAIETKNKIRSRANAFIHRPGAGDIIVHNKFHIHRAPGNVNDTRLLLVGPVLD